MMMLEMQAEWDAREAAAKAAEEAEKACLLYTSLPKEVVLDLPLVSMVGQDEVTVENHKGWLNHIKQTLVVSDDDGRCLVMPVVVTDTEIISQLHSGFPAGQSE